MNKFKSSGPRRNVVRRIYAHDNGTISNTEESVDIFTAGVDCTLIRTIIELDLIAISDTNCKYVGSIQRDPNSKRVTSTNDTGAGDIGDIPDELITRWTGNSNVRLHDTAASQDTNMYTKSIYKDLKGMRKLQKGDTIGLSEVASTAGVIATFGQITMFFKET